MKRCIVSLLLLLIATSFAVAQPFTRRSSQEKHDGLKKYYEIPDFKLGGKYDLADPKKWEFGGEGGTTLESLGAGKLRTAYIAIGTPRRNAAGEITNAVVISSYYSGDSTDMYEQWVVGTALSGGVPIIGSGRPIDTDRYYVVMVDPLGTWGASKPSDKLGKKFPQYSYYDMVQANYRLLRDHLKISNVALATGVSMGGTQTYVWGVMHPEYVQALMPIGGTTQSDAEDPVGNWTFQLMTAAIESDPVWQATKGDYYNLPKEKHPLPGVAFGWSVLGLTGYDLSYRTTQAFTAVQPEVFYWDPPNEKAGSSVNKRAAIYDAVDLVWRNRVGETHNINPYLGRIQSRTLVMHITNDLWLNFKLAQRAVDKIPGADLIAEESPVAHYGVFSIINNRKHDAKFVAFLEDVARLNKQQQFVAKNYRVASVDTDIDPKKSFWKDAVTYPFPVKYATVKDSTGTSWQIGYMDEYAGTDKNPPVLVVVHGKGAFAGHYGNVIKQAVESGIRVIAPDLPHYGMSGPGNLDKNPARSMQDMRDVVHELVVNQLGVKQAHYLGHSLGGQVILGYALNWPEAVKGLILEAPAGLEEYPAEVAIAPGKTAKLFDPGVWPRFQQVARGLGPDRHSRQRNRAQRAKHPRLLLFQEARSRDGRRVEGPERVLHERQRICPFAYRAAGRADQGQSERTGAVVECLHLRHLWHGGRTAEGRPEEPLPASNADQGADLPGLRRQGAVHSRDRPERAEGPRGWRHRSVHRAHGGRRQSSDREDLSRYGSLHPYGQSGAVRDRCRRLRRARQRRRQLAGRHRSSGQWRLQRGDPRCCTNAARCIADRRPEQVGV